MKFTYNDDGHDDYISLRLQRLLHKKPAFQTGVMEFEDMGIYHMILMILSCIMGIALEEFLELTHIRE